MDDRDSTLANHLAGKDLEGRDAGYERPKCSKSWQEVAWFGAGPFGVCRLKALPYCGIWTYGAFRRRDLSFRRWLNMNKHIENRD